MFSSAVDLRASGKHYETTDPLSTLIASKRTSEDEERPDYPRKLNASRNILQTLPNDFILSLKCLVELDVSDNRLKTIDCGLSQLPELKVVDVRGNHLHSLPDDISNCPSLLELNLGENTFEAFPMQLLEMPRLKQLYLGSNKIANLPSDIKKMTGLEVLFLGGNRLQAIPHEISELHLLHSLALCHNVLTGLPLAVCEMHSLVSLQLHNNRLETLPPALLHMQNLREISLRNNPLVSRFVRDHVDDVPPLQELAARTIKKASVPYSADSLPSILINYLDSSQRCDNPECLGVYFHVFYRQVKFVDFCGKYRIPFLHYLCSPQCHYSVPGHSSAFSTASSSSQSSEDTGDESDARERRKMRRVLIAEP